jgi:hypothetical protein
MVPEVSDDSMHEYILLNSSVVKITEKNVMSRNYDYFS